MVCKQCNWREIDRLEHTGWGQIVWREILFQCQGCGRLQKVRLGEKPNS